MTEELEKCFPRLGETDYRVTSKKTTAYNCIAWTANDTRRWWWPDPFGIYYWPPGAPREETLAAFRAAFDTLSYADCEGAAHTQHVEKIAFYCGAGGTPTHAARQLPSGRWTSKCGSLEDIEHELDALAESSYGNVACCMARAWQAESG